MERIFSKQYLKDTLYDDGGGKVIEDTITDNGRWSIYHSLIFEADDGLFYETSYSVGATEQQDESPFEYDEDEIACTQVHKVPKTVEVWEAV